MNLIYTLFLFLICSFILYCTNFVNVCHLLLCHRVSIKLIVLHDKYVSPPGDLDIIDKNYCT